jgi:hypothetical protein
MPNKPDPNCPNCKGKGEFQSFTGLEPCFCDVRVRQPVPNKQWTHARPNAKHIAQWFIVRLGKNIFFAEIRKDGDILYLCPPSTTGLRKTSFGTQLHLWPKETEFWGPIEMPADYRS